MGRRYGIAVVMVWGWCCGLVVAPQVVAAGKPNIVHIMIDDLGWQDVACYYRAQHGEETVLRDAAPGSSGAAGDSLHAGRILRP